MAAISSSRVTDERVTCLRIFADADGETHMEEVDIALQPRKLFKDNPPLRLSESFAASGDIRRLAAGSILLAEDTTGKGHISRHPPEGQLVIHVAVDNAAAMYPVRR